MTDALPSVRQFATIANALDEARDYFERLSWCDSGGPNKELRLANEIEQAQEALKSLRCLVATKPELVVSNEIATGPR